MEDSLSIGQKQQLAKRVEPFIMKNDVLYRMGHDNKLKQHMSTTKAQKMMNELHEGIARRHFVTKITSKKILDARY
jgi:hypothetical protein